MLTVTDKKNEFKLGRGHESEVRINDISVSRCHAIIKCKKDGFYIEDNLSKFGTIVLLKEKLRLAEDHTMAVQVGRSVVSFTIKNIDVREKLKREIAPLLSRTRRQEAEKAALERDGSKDMLQRIDEGQLPTREAGKSMGPTLIRNNMLTSSALNSNGNGRAMSGVGERVNSSDAVTGVSGVLGQAGNQVASAYG